MSIESQTGYIFEPITSGRCPEPTEEEVLRLREIYAEHDRIKADTPSGDPIREQQMALGAMVNDMQNRRWSLTNF